MESPLPLYQTHQSTCAHQETALCPAFFCTAKPNDAERWYLVFRCCFGNQHVVPYFSAGRGTLLLFCVYRVSEFEIPRMPRAVPVKIYWAMKGNRKGAGRRYFAGSYDGLIL